MLKGVYSRQLSRWTQMMGVVYTNLGLTVRLKSCWNAPWRPSVARSGRNIATP